MVRSKEEVRKKAMEKDKENKQEVQGKETPKYKGEDLVMEKDEVKKGQVEKGTVNYKVKKQVKDKEKEADNEMKDNGASVSQSSASSQATLYLGADTQVVVEDSQAEDGHVY